MRQRNRLKQDLFANIPPEIIIAILSKLPLLTIISCKRVCKSWLNLLESREFVNSHLLKPIPGLAVHRSRSKWYKLFEFDDGLDLQHHRLHYKPLTKFKIPACNGWIMGSTNGLLFLCDTSDHHLLHVCNPITRDYIQLDCNRFVYSCNDFVAFGFGTSKITGQHKVVGILQAGNSYPYPEQVCHVYTIGTGSWRRIPAVAPLVYDCYSDGAFLNGNLHWLVSDFEVPRKWISCFDLETECFSTFSTPVYNLSSDPTILDGCLCLCDNSVDDGICIWLMKEYGVEKSWTKLFSISDAMALEARNSYIDHLFYAIKIFKDGDILLEKENEFLFYSKKNNTVQKLETFGPPNCDIKASIYTPSFLSLKSFGMEKVISF